MSDTAGIIFLVGRVLFASFFLFTGLYHLAQPKPSVEHARAVGLPLPFLAGWPTGAWLLAGGLSVSLGLWPDVGALMLGVFVLPATFWFHAFWNASEDQKQMQLMAFVRNVTYAGAALSLFAVFAAADASIRYSITGSLIGLT